MAPDLVAARMALQPTYALSAKLEKTGGGVCSQTMLPFGFVFYRSDFSRR
jgi:hypothetical protein